MESFLAGGRVKTGHGEVAEFVEDCLCSRFVADGCANIVDFKEVAETGEVAGACDGRENVRIVRGEEWLVGGVGTGRGGVDGGELGPELALEGDGVVEEGEVPTVVGE